MAEATEPLTEPAEGFDDAKDMECPGGIGAPVLGVGVYACYYFESASEEH